MSVRQDTINLQVNINGNESQNKLNELRNKAGQLATEMKGLKKNTDEYIAKGKELGTVTAEMDKLKKQIGITALSQKELVAELRKLNALKGSVVPFSNEFKALQKEIVGVEKRLYDVRNGVQGFQSFLSKLSDGVKQFGVIAAGYLGFQFLSSQFKNILQGAGKLSDQLADLRRVTGLTKDEANDFNKSLKELNTRTSTEGLREIAIIAGKLGVAKDDILGFTQAVDKLVVSLGDELGNADQITTSLGKILNVFDGKVTGETITKLGNAFVVLANAGVATGGFIADFDQRLSGLAKSAGIGLGELSGLGGGLEELGSRVESSSTAVQKLLITIASDLPKAAKIAGKSTEEFSKLYGRDATEALLQYSEGLVRNKKSFGDVTSALKDAGEEGVRTIETIAKLGGNADLLRVKIKLGAEALQETSAINSAFALKNETLGSTLDKLGKEFNRLTTSPAVQNFLIGAVNGATAFIQALKQIPKFINDNSTAIKLLVLGVVLLNGAYIKQAALIIYNTAAKIANTIATRVSTAATVLAEVAQASYLTITALLTGQITLATAAQRLWSIALSVGLGPLGILVTVLGAAVVAYNVFTGASNQAATAQSILAETTREANKETNKQKAEIAGLTAVINDNSISLGTREAALKKLIAISPEYLGRLTLENIATDEGRGILERYNKALQASANIKAANAIQEKQQQKDTDLRTAQQELEIFKTTRDRAGLGDIAKDALLNVSGAGNPVDVALNAIKAKIQIQAGAVKASTDNFVTQTKAADVARREFLLKEVTATAKEKAQFAAGTKEYEAAAKKHAEARKKYNDEFNKGTGQSGSDAAAGTVGGGDDKKSAKESAARIKRQEDEYNRLRADAEKFYKEIQKLKDKTAAGDDSEQKEIQAAEQKYKDLLDRAKDFYLKHAIDQKRFGEEEKIISEAQAQELQAIFDKYYKRRFDEGSQKEYEDSLNNLQNFFDEQRLATAKAYADGTLSKKQYEEKIKDLERQETGARITIATDYKDTVKKAGDDLVKENKKNQLQQTKDVVEETDKRNKSTVDEILAQKRLNILTARPGSKGELEAKKALLQKQFELDTEELDKESALYLEKKQLLNDGLSALDDEYFANRVKKVEQYAQYFVQALTSINTILGNLETRAFNKEKAVNDKRKIEFKKQLDSKLISQAQYDKKVAALQEQQDARERELKRKQAKREKAVNLLSAVVNTASAVVEALPNIPLAIIVGALGALQIGAIASAPLPELGRGGFLQNGPSHSDTDKGLHVVNPRSGRTEMLVERGEAVINKKALRSNRMMNLSGTPMQIASALNSAFGGVSFGGGARSMGAGPSINGNMPRIMAVGGLIAGAEEAFAQQSNEVQLAMLANIKALREDIQAFDREKKSYVVYREITSKGQQYNEARRAGSITQ